MALITPDPANPQGQIQASQFASPAEVEDEAALQLCVQDAQTFEAWLQNNYWVLRWREADALYQSPPGILMWEGTTVPRANVNRFVVAETVNAIHPQVMNGLFYETPSFVLRPRPGEDQNTTRAITELMAVELQQMEFRQEVDWGLFSALNFGTGIWKWGFKSYVKKEETYKRVGDNVVIQPRQPGQPATEIETEDSTTYEKVMEEKEVYVPTFEAKDIRYVLVDPGCHWPDIRRAKAVVDRMYMTYKDLEKLADEEYVAVEDGKQVLKKRYKLPSKEEIKSWFEPPKEQPEEPNKTEAVSVQSTTFVHHAKAPFQKTTADPLDEPLEVLERWDNDKVITVINRKKLIRNESNEFGVIPYLSLNWWNIPDAFWGLGLGRVIGVEQRVQQGIINAMLDLASLIVNPMWARARAANVQDQQIRQRIGGLLTLDVGGTTGLRSVSDGLQMIQQPHIPAEIFQQIALSMQRVEMTSGASQQLTMGASPVGGAKGGQLGRSGTGAAGIIQATMNRIGGFAEAFVRQVFEPLLYQMHRMNKDKLPIGYIREVLGEKLGPEFKFNHGDFLNAPAEFEVLAGSHLAAKSQMAQSLFMMLQLFESAPLMDQLAKVAQKKVNVEELFHMVHDLSGFKNYYNIVVDMTPEEKQRMAAQANPAAMKLQGQAALADQKFGHDQELIDQENEGRIVRDIFRHIAKTSAMPETLGEGTPATGMGSVEVA